MRGTRWLIVVAIILLLAGVAATYRLQKKELHDQAPAKPEAMAAGLTSKAQDWSWIETSEPPDSRTICMVKARDARQAKDSNHVELEQVELRMPSMHTDTYNLVHSAHAEYSQSEKRLYSDGAVDITLAVPNEGQPNHTLVSIHSSGVTFDSGTGKATTDREATFKFENGDGKSVGASYDPNTRELVLKSQALLHWSPPGPHAKPLKIEAGQVIYRENLEGIWLTPWARLTRENTIVEAGETVIALQDRTIHHVEAHNAHGTDAYPNRKLQYGADRLFVDYGDTGQVEKITGEGQARLISNSEGSQVTATGDRVEMQFTDNNGESVLNLATVTGHGFLESKPDGPPVPGKDPAETRILRSEIIQMNMRPGGRELAGIETHAPSELEFLPNHAGQRHRKFIGERMWIAYGSQNRIQSFRAVNCRTISDPTPEEAARKKPVATTVSKNVSAFFDPKTSQLTRMEQWEDFSYEAGDRRARADRGILEQVENRITLDQHARMWDGTGNTIADRIVLDEKSGNFTAEGHVNSSRMPDQSKKKSDSAMLSGDEPLEAVANKMSSANHNKLVKYDGNAVLWQGVNRIQADHVEIDRDKRTIIADGHVITQSREDKKAADAPAQEAAAGAAPAPSVFTLVKAPHMIYTDQDRLAHYSGGVLLNRGNLQMKSLDLRSWLAEEGADNRLQKAFADGAVQIVQTGPLRTKTGTSEHAEYYTDENKIILRGGNPTMADNVRGNTRGTELTYFSDDDRLLVKGSESDPAVSHIRRKHAQ